MDEEILNSTEAEVEEQTTGTENEVVDSEDDGWGDVQWGEDDGKGEDSIGEETETDQSDVVIGEQKEKTAQPKQGKQNTQTEEADQFLDLKYMGAERKVSRDEARTLAQKGLDYDRIRSERDAMQQDYGKLKRYESFLNELKGDFKDVDAMIADTRARMLSDKEHISYSDAVAKLKVMDGEKNKANDAQAKSQAAVQKFIERFPGVKAEDIPQSVWEDVKKTGDLTEAYEKYNSKMQADKIASLEKEIASLKQNQKNKARSPGSSSTSGKTGAKSMIQQLWEEDDY